MHMRRSRRGFLGVVGAAGAAVVATWSPLGLGRAQGTAAPVPPDADIYGGFLLLLPGVEAPIYAGGSQVPPPVLERLSGDTTADYDGTRFVSVGQDVREVQRAGGPRLHALPGGDAGLFSGDAVIVYGSTGGLYAATTSLLRGEPEAPTPEVVLTAFPHTDQPAPFWAGGTPRYGPDPVIRGRTPLPYVANPTADGFFANWFEGQTMYTLDYRLGRSLSQFEMYLTELVAE